MRLSDWHTHSSCSPDGFSPMKELAQAAFAAGLSELCVTDHCDFLSMDGRRHTLSYDWAPVLSQFEEMERLYSGRLTLRLGLEFGMPHLSPEAANTVLSQPRLDFVIGSVHNRCEARGGLDLYCTHYGDLDSCYADLDDYFTSVETLASTDAYDVLGHIIYPLRYMADRDGQNPDLSRYYGRMEAIFRTTVQNGKGIELNTNRARTLAEWKPILALYRGCGGEIITVGSDAHTTNAVGLGIEAGYELLRGAGFRYVASFQGRRPQFHKLA